MNVPLLRVADLAVSFRSAANGAIGSWRQVLSDLSFQVNARETVAVVGESGSGKSVSALAILRLLDPKQVTISGRVELEGVDLLTLPETRMRRIRGNQIAMIFQEPMTSLNPVFTVGRQIAEAIIAHRDCALEQADAEAERLLQRVRIPAAGSRLDDYPHQFSGGMRQRVLIAMALACKPKLLIADEPTTALDVTVQAQILALIRELQNEDGMAVLFITHDMGVVAEIADRTLVMYQGKLVEQGPTAQVFSSPSQPYTRALLAAVPQLGSMQGETHPMPFPLIDKQTGEHVASPESCDTVVQDGEPILNVQNLTKRFDVHKGLFRKLSARVHAVENLSFTVRAGETLALVGESGCGKSTTGRAIVRLQDAQTGSVWFEGTDLRQLSLTDMRAMRRHVQMIFQDPYASLNPRMSIGASIAEPIVVHGLGDRAFARARVAELLARVGLDPVMENRYPQEFSGGQRQRISIARALAVNPRLIVADEAVSALDVSVKAQVCNLLLDLQASLKLAYLFISHDMAIVERMCHRVAVMYAGEILEMGPREAVFANPQHAYTQRLLSAVPLPDPSRRHLRREVSGSELVSPMRSLDYMPTTRTYLEVSPGHLVQVGTDAKAPLPV